MIRPALRLVRPPARQLPRILGAWHCCGPYVVLELYPADVWKQMTDVERIGSHARYLLQVGCYATLKSVDRAEAEETCRIGFAEGDAWERRRRADRRRRREQAPA